MCLANIKTIIIVIHHLNMAYHMKISGIQMTSIGDSKQGLKRVCWSFFYIKKCNARSNICVR